MAPDDVVPTVPTVMHIQPVKTPENTCSDVLTQHERM